MANAKITYYNEDGSLKQTAETEFNGTKLKSFVTTRADGTYYGQKNFIYDKSGNLVSFTHISNKTNDKDNEKTYKYVCQSKVPANSQLANMVNSKSGLIQSVQYNSSTKKFTCVIVDSSGKKTKYTYDSKGNKV